MNIGKNGRSGINGIVAVQAAQVVPVVQAVVVVVVVVRKLGGKDGIMDGVKAALIAILQRVHMDIGIGKRGDCLFVCFVCFFLFGCLFFDCIDH